METKTRQSDQPTETEKTEYTEAEIERIQKYISECKTAPKPLKYDAKKDDDDGITLALIDDPENNETWLKIYETAGTTDPSLGQLLIHQSILASARTSDKENMEQMANAVAAGMLGIAPKDEIEGMLASQMVAVHNQAMKFLNLALSNQNLAIVREMQNVSNRLLRTFTLQMEALTKYRKKAEQTVRVEHVHIHSGAQAIVGTVSHNQLQREGGTDEKYGSSPCTGRIEDRTGGVTLDLPEGEKVWSENPERWELQESGDEERALPSSRRKKHGGAQG